MILHVGDFAYNMNDGSVRQPNVSGACADEFMRNIEPVAGRLAYHGLPGNHEYADEFAQYTVRFRNSVGSGSSGTVETGNGPASGNNWCYSWDAGLVHYAAISSEVYFGAGNSSMLQLQFDWLKADLKKANANRAAVPWIVVAAHRSMYCSCDGDCDGPAADMRNGINGGKAALEPLFFH